MPLLLPYRTIYPKIDPTCFIAENAVIIGDTTIGPDSSVWYNVAIRGDVNDIKIGARTNIQDGAVIHVSSTTQGTYVGDDVTVGHMALLHACTVGSRTLIGMGAIVMDQAVIGDNCILAAGALIPPRKVIPSRQLWAGSPAKYVRDVTEDDIFMLKISAEKYVSLAHEYRE